MGVSFARPDVADLMFHVFERSVHPELFRVYKEQGVWCDAYSARIAICEAGHAVSFRCGGRTLTEVATTRGQLLPEKKQSFAKRLLGSRDESLRLDNGIRYQVSFHLEQLDPEVFFTIHEELLLDCARNELSYCFSGGNRFAPAPLSLIRTDAKKDSLLVHAYHTFPDCCAIVKSQSLFEI